MARTVNQEEHAARRNEILDAAQRLLFSKGYARMTLQDLLRELQISSGAFYHYFDSKPAVLDAFIERIRQEVERPLLPIVNAYDLSALEKLQRFFDTLDSLRLAHKDEVVTLGRVWYNDDNALVRQKVDEAVIKQRAPLLAAIVHQGVREGVFTTAYPDQAGEVILSLLQGMGATHARLMFAFDHDHDPQRCTEAIIATHAAYMDAVERVLGAPERSLYRADADAVSVWVAALR